MINWQVPISIWSNLLAPQLIWTSSLNQMIGERAPIGYAEAIVEKKLRLSKEGLETGKAAFVGRRYDLSSSMVRQHRQQGRAAFEGYWANAKLRTDKGVAA